MHDLTRISKWHAPWRCRRCLNGTPVEDPSHLSRLVSDAQIGSTAAVTVIRDGKRVTLKIPIARVPRSN